MRLIIRLLAVVWVFQNLPAQPSQTSQPPKLSKYWVEFFDKKGTPFRLDRPADFLSPRALERRARASIPVVENDLPVSPIYIGRLQMTGVKIHLASRWLNAAAVIADSAQIARIRTLNFVKKVLPLGKNLNPRNPPNRPLKKRKPLKIKPKIDSPDASDLGYASLQNSLLGTSYLYYAGLRGQDKWVVVMDGGFTNVDTLPFFDSLALAGRLFSGWDFVEHDNYVFEAAEHGTSVLSVMASNLPGYFVGTAPDATYFCVKTEDTGGEFPVEEANWIAGAEWADSLGADIIIASLGYTVFNDTSLSHKYLDLNGRTAIGSRGATIAAQKGMLICNAAGNEGDGPWRHIGIPADAPGIVCVGAVDYHEKRAAFSSVGPTADGRIKPDLVAPGQQLITASVKGVDLGMSSGTSVASPMLAGGLASLWSAFPEKTATEILDAVFASASQNERPDNELGWGLPDLTTAYLRLAGFLHGKFLNRTGERRSIFSCLPGRISIQTADDLLLPGSRIFLQNGLGEEIPLRSARTVRSDISTLTLEFSDRVPHGFYTVWVKNEAGSTHWRIEH